MTGDKRQPWPAGASRRGFTLMEMIVVLGLFSIVMVSASDIFLMSNRTQRKTLNLERVQSDARYAMEAMVREIRSGAIDYPWYADNGKPIDGTGPTDTLAVIDGQGDRVVMYKSDQCGDTDTQSCLVVQLNDGDPQVLTPRGVNIYKAAFYIRPNVSPYVFDSSTGQ
jgi:prepilin-type N-terminal cleavage/methylation domain-containing protein